MQKDFELKDVYRIIDANINRTKEGLRVCEEFTRFILNDHSLTTRIKSARHKLVDLTEDLAGNKHLLLSARNSQADIGKNILANELKRKDIKDIFYANLARVKESVRVLEEFSKLINKRLAIRFKDIRYSIYDIEKKAAAKI